MRKRRKLGSPFSFSIHAPLHTSRAISMPAELINVVVVGLGLSGAPLCRSLAASLPTTHRIVAITAQDFGYYPVASLRAAVVRSSSLPSRDPKLNIRTFSGAELGGIDHRACRYSLPLWIAPRHSLLDHRSLPRRKLRHHPEERRGGRGDYPLLPLCNRHRIDVRLPRSTSYRRDYYRRSPCRIQNSPNSNRRC